MDMDDDMQEQLEQVRRWEENIKGKEKYWFDSDDYVQIIDYFINKDQLEKAKNVLDEAIAFYPDSEGVLTQKVNYHIRKDDYRSAIKVMEQVVSDNPTEEHLLDLADLYFDSKLYLDKAQTILIYLLDKGDKDVHIYYLLTSIYLAYEQYDEAEKYCRQALIMEPKNENVAELYVECGSWAKSKDKFISFLESLVKQDPFNDIAWAALADLYYNSGDIELAEQAVDCALAIDERSERRNYYKAECLLSRNEIDAAAYHISMACKYCKSDNLPEYLLTLASILIVKKQWGRALVCLKGVDLFAIADENAEDNVDYQYLLRMALCYYETDNIASMVECVHKAVDNKVKNEDFLNFGKLLIDWQYYKECKAIFYELYQTETLNDKLRDIALVLYAASTYIVGDKMDGYAMLNSLLDEDLDNKTLANIISVLCIRQLFDEFTIKALRKVEPKKIDDFIKKYLDKNIAGGRNFKRCLKTALQ